MKVFYEDNDIIVCEKPVGVVSQESEKGGTMPQMLREYFSDNALKAEPYCVHRLDREVGGIMVFAKNQKSAAALSSIIAKGEMRKTYLAAVHGRPENDSGEMRDLLFKDSSKNKSFVVKRMRRGVKEAILDYSVLLYDSENDLSLVKIKLKTGRTHQIRVQFASRKTPLFGDSKYGGRDGENSIALWSAGLEFSLPDGKRIDFFCFPESKYPWNLFPEIDTPR